MASGGKFLRCRKCKKTKRKSALSRKCSPLLQPLINLFTFNFSLFKNDRYLFDSLDEFLFYSYLRERIQPWSPPPDTGHRQPSVLATFFFCVRDSPVFFFISQSNGGSVSLAGPGQNTAEHCNFMPSRHINLSPWLAMNLLGLSGHTVWHCCTWH